MASSTKKKANSKTQFARYVRFPLEPPRADYLILPAGPPSETYYDPLEGKWCAENRWPEDLATAAQRKAYIMDELRRHRRLATNVPKHPEVSNADLGMVEPTTKLCFQMRNYINGEMIRDWAM